MSETSAVEEFLTVDEIATMLELNPQTVRSMIDRGELPAIRVGSRRVRVLRSDLDAFLEERKRLTKRSARRVGFDDAVASATKMLRSHDQPHSAEALRRLSRAALALAKEIDKPTG